MQLTFYFVAQVMIGTFYNKKIIPKNETVSTF